MKNFILISALMATTLCANTFADEITIVAEVYPPYEYVENGQWVGHDADIVREVCKRIGVTPVFKEYPWKRCIKMMKEGKAEGIISLFNTPERRKFLFFPAFNMSYEKNVIFANKGSGIKMDGLEDIKGKKLGVQAEYSYGERFDNFKGLEKDYSYSLESLVRKLDIGRMEIVIGNESVIMHMNKKMGLKPIEAIYTVSNDPLHIGFSSVHPKGKELADKFGKILGDMKQEGLVDKIIGKYR